MAGRRSEEMPKTDPVLYALVSEISKTLREGTLPDSIVEHLRPFFVRWKVPEDQYRAISEDACFLLASLFGRVCVKKGEFSSLQLYSHRG